MSLGLHRLQRKRILQQAVGVADLQAIGGGAIHPAGKADGTRCPLLLPRLDEPLGLHPGQQHVDRAALDRTAGSLDELEAESLAILEQIEEERFTSRNRRKPYVAHVERSYTGSVSCQGRCRIPDRLGYSAVSPGFNSSTSTPFAATRAFKSDGVPVRRGNVPQCIGTT